MGAMAQLSIIVLLLITGLTIPVVMWRLRGRQPIAQRLEELSGNADPKAPPPRTIHVSQVALKNTIELLNPVAGVERNRLKKELIQAGLYRPSAMTIYLGVKLILMLGPVVVGVGIGLTNAIPLSKGILYGTIASGLGLVVPSYGLGRMKTARQLKVRRAIPEFLDVVGICLDAGLSFQASVQRVYSELEAPFPAFAFELNIVLHEVQLGMTTGEALQRFAQRSGMEEVRSLASVVIQSERYGASLTKALHRHAQSLRIKRAQAAEEKGQRASVKILFPTILFIFPAIFLVIVGPAMIQVYEMMGKSK
jgi:tight adherence protein C